MIGHMLYQNKKEFYPVIVFFLFPETKKITGKVLLKERIDIK